MIENCWSVSTGTVRMAENCWSVSRATVRVVKFSCLELSGFPCWSIHGGKLSVRPLALVLCTEGAPGSLEAGLKRVDPRGSTIQESSLCSLGARFATSNQLTLLVGLCERDRGSEVAANVRVWAVVSRHARKHQ